MSGSKPLLHLQLGLLWVWRALQKPRWSLTPAPGVLALWLWRVAHECARLTWLPYLWRRAGWCGLLALPIQLLAPPQVLLKPLLLLVWRELDCFPARQSWAERPQSAWRRPGLPLGCGQLLRGLWAVDLTAPGEGALRSLEYRSPTGEEGRPPHPLISLEARICIASLQAPTKFARRGSQIPNFSRT